MASILIVRCWEEQGMTTRMSAVDWTPVPADWVRSLTPISVLGEDEMAFPGCVLGRSLTVETPFRLSLIGGGHP